MDKLLDEYDNAVSLHISHPENIDYYLNLRVEDIEKMTSEACIEAAAVLTQYAICIQKLTNKEMCRIKWCNAILDRVCSREWNSYDQYTKAAIKIEMIARQNAAVDKTIRIRNNAELKLENFNNISHLIKYYSDVMIEGARTKRKVIQ